MLIHPHYREHLEILAAEASIRAICPREEDSEALLAIARNRAGTGPSSYLTALRDIQMELSEAVPVPRNNLAPVAK